MGEFQTSNEQKSIEDKDLKLKFRYYSSKEKAIRIITEAIATILLITLIVLTILSIMKQTTNYIIYIIIIMIYFIPHEILERKLKKNAQRRMIKDLIERKIEMEQIKHPYTHTPPPVYKPITQKEEEIKVNFCPYCGDQIPKDANYCDNCGRRLN